MSWFHRVGRGNWIKLAALPVVALLVILVFQFTALTPAQFTPTNVKNYILRFGTLAPVVFILIYALRAVILVIPVGVMSLAGGLAFGKWWGTVFILIGAVIGSSLSFLIARFLGRKFIESFAWLHKGRIKSFDEGSEKHGFRLILFVRLIPLFQYDAVNFGAGLSKMRFRHFFLGSLIGMIPGGFINALMGSSLENVISVQFFVALGVFLLLMFVPAIYKLIKRKKRNPAKTPAGS